ncbi:MAG: FmdB family zinc ribbon protein [Candidatus Baltobacteraceae bacterium]
MPLYDYRCSSCGTIREIRHGFDESVNDPCAGCGGELVRVFNPAPILFKGSGFYITDSRPSGGSSESSSSSASSESTSSGGTGESAA